MTTLTATSSSRRDRIRQQTLSEIKAAARAQVERDGPGAIQLRAVARDVGLTAPALYRYFPSLEDLIEAVTADLFSELCDAMEHDSDGVADAFDRMLALARSFRHWAVTNRHEFGLLFAIAPTALGSQPSNACQEASDRFGNLFAAAFVGIWDSAPFPVADVDDLPADLSKGLLSYWTWLTENVAPHMPMGAVVAFLEGWVRIFGCVAMEAFGHLSWALADGEPMFEQVMHSLAAMVGRPDAYRQPA